MEAHETLAEFEMISALVLSRESSAGTQHYLSPEILVEEFDDRFLNEDWCRLWVLNRLHGKSPNCPNCLTDIKDGQRERFWRNERLQCHWCRKWFTALTSTVFAGTRMSFSEIVLLLFLLGMKQPVRFIARILDYDASAIRIWRRKFEKNR